MFGSTLIKIFSAVAIAQAVLAAPSATTNVKSSALTNHNKYRSKHHVAGVRWNQKLANHAKKVSKSCVWGHNVLKGTGQNIAYGYPSMKSVIDAWYNEVSDYNYNSGSSFGGVTGHFTQVVWKGTTEIGCAATYCDNLGGFYYVCDYNPPGNYYGEYTANVFKP
ncbi:hypothetical protein HPULCUR_007551 [Helicostylum pulchrum]|uniref:SCP domain-containing protein n=1 Tax=Helicostylum pulchrum TaxID=562976 RepID=A0ABP9Y551_9FUNG